MSENSNTETQWAGNVLKHRGHGGEVGGDRWVSRQDANAQSWSGHAVGIKGAQRQWPPPYEGGAGGVRQTIEVEKTFVVEDGRACESDDASKLGRLL